MQRAIIHSYGGGNQSAAIAVLVKRGLLPRPERIVMADTGREATETWEYTDRYIRPLLKSIGLEIEIAPHTLATVDLYRDGQLLIPAASKTGRLNTYCSGEWKRDVVRRYLRALGYGPDRPVTMWIGISLDEIGRAKPGRVKWIEHAWPLLMDVTMRRRECAALVESEGLPTPPKSSCWMCPWRRNSQWRRLRDHYPADFEKACVVDDEIGAADQMGGVWLHDSRVRLRDADLEEPERKQSSLFGEVEEGCDSGMCWT